MPGILNMYNHPGKNKNLKTPLLGWVWWYIPTLL